MRKPHVCPACDGRRVQGTAGPPCPTCAGEGVVWEPEGAQEGAEVEREGALDLTYRA